MFIVVPSEQFSLSLDDDVLVWRKEGGVARLRIAQISLHPASLGPVQVCTLMIPKNKSYLEAANKPVSLRWVI